MCQEGGLDEPWDAEGGGDEYDAERRIGTDKEVLESC